MVHQHYWKQPLVEAAKLLLPRNTPSKWTEKRLHELELQIVFSFFALRRLIETFKVTQSCRNTALSLTQYPLLKPVVFIHLHRFEKHVDWDSPRKVTKDLMFLCNQFVHSYVCFPLLAARRQLEGFCVFSDFERESSAYIVSSDELRRIYRFVLEDSPSKWNYKYDGKKRDYHISVD